MMKTFDRYSASTRPKPQDASLHETTEGAWHALYRIGAVAALITVGCVLVAIPIFLIWPPPGGLLPTASTVIDCFTLFQKNWLLGLLDLDLMMLVSTLLVIPIYLALYASLRRASPSLTAIALTLGLVGTTAYLTVNPAFTMFSLSTHYAAASAEQRPLFVAAGQAVLAGYQGTGFDMSYCLGAVATLIVAVVMLRSTVFGKATAYLGIATGVLMIVPPTVGTIGVYLSLLSLLPLVIWYVLVAQRLLQLARGVAKDGAKQH